MGYQRLEPSGVGALVAAWSASNSISYPFVSCLSSWQYLLFQQFLDMEILWRVDRIVQLQGGQARVRACGHEALGCSFTQSLGIKSCAKPCFGQAPWLTYHPNETTTHVHGLLP